jgi:hypothetical protein
MITGINFFQTLTVINKSERWKSFTQKFQIFAPREMVSSDINMIFPSSGVIGSGVRHK